MRTTVKSIVLLLVLGLLATGSFGCVITDKIPNGFACTPRKVEEQQYGTTLAERGAMDLPPGTKPPAATEQTATTGSATASGGHVRGTLIFSTDNAGGLEGPPPPAKSPSFELSESKHIVYIQDYHYNNGRGAAPGTIGLRDATGKMYGPWKAEAGEGVGRDGGAPLNWNAYPDVELPPGTYTVVDSAPGTWAWDSGSKGRGMTQVEAAN